MNKIDFPLISIIVPIYKVEKYLPACINSILAQTYENFELILVDDGSPDNCGKICDQYATIDNRVKVIHKPNGGVSSARNKGLEFSRGEFIAFIDADDYIDTTYIEHLIQYDSFDLVTNSEQNSTIEFIENDIQHYVDTYGRSLYGTSPWGKIYNKNIITEHNLKFDTNERFGEDTLFNLL